MSNKNFEIKTDCFAFRNNHTCNALNDLYCAKENCKFYKTRKQFLDEQICSTNKN